MHSGTMQSGSGLHSGMPSPSLGMFKLGSFNRSSRQGTGTNYLNKMQGVAGYQHTQVKAKKPAAPKTSAYMSRYRATTKTASFWGDLHKMVEKSGKIENIDARMGVKQQAGPATSLNTRPRSHR